MESRPGKSQSISGKLEIDAQGQMPVTIEMVAKAAGVSPSTVSRILNGTAGVADVKRQAVNSAIDRLGFIPNPVARGLAGGRTLSIGVVTQSLDSPFYGAALRGIEIEFQKVGYTPLFISGQWNQLEEARCLDLLRARRVDGIIILDGRVDDADVCSLARNLPVVITGRSLQAPNVASLNFSNFEGAEQATQYLIELGHRRIVFIAGDPEHQDALERQRGYRAALQARGVAIDEALVVPGNFSEESGLRAVEGLLSQGKKFSAIFAANDQMAFGAALALYRHALRIPDDVSLIGFDDLQPSVYAIPPLTTVHQPSHEMGTLAATAMLQLLHGERPVLSMPSPRLILRESTAAPSR